MSYFQSHEKLEVYHYSLSFTVLADKVSNSLPRGRAYLVDQLRRAATSIPLNIAEGAGEFSPSEKCRFYRMAKRSATECSSILDVMRSLQLVEEKHFVEAMEALCRIVAMLITMIKRIGDKAH
ncbi:MAG: four helix bundle protein [Chlamydiia bacterium]|nr:four helix bundle protein [Chlamydiia bacterium]